MSCDPSSCSGAEVELGPIRPSHLSYDPDGHAWARITGDDVLLLEGTAEAVTEAFSGTRFDGRYTDRRQPTSEYVAYGGEAMPMGYWSGHEDSLPVFRLAILDELRAGVGEEDAGDVPVGIYRVLHEGEEGKEDEQGERVWFGTIATEAE